MPRGPSRFPAFDRFCVALQGDARGLTCFDAMLTEQWSVEGSGQLHVDDAGVWRAGDSQLYRLDLYGNELWQRPFGVRVR